MGERVNHAGMSKLIICVFYKVCFFFFWLCYLIKLECNIQMFIFFKVFHPQVFNMYKGK